MRKRQRSENTIPRQENSGRGLLHRYIVRTATSKDVIAFGCISTVSSVTANTSVSPTTAASTPVDTAELFQGDKILCIVVLDQLASSRHRKCFTGNSHIVFAVFNTFRRESDR